MSLLISEIGSNHLGSMKLAKELIRISHESGADLIKGQAYKAEDIKKGSMPLEFYKQCELTEVQCIELLDYARSIGTDMFFSIFSEGFDNLSHIQTWHKLAASQTEGLKINSELDKEFNVMSFSKATIQLKKLPKIKKAWPLYATPYMAEDPDIYMIGRLKDQVGDQVGLSDHNYGTRYCLEAINDYDVVAIEKHFTLNKDVSWNGIVFRDTVHGAIPNELEVIANALNKG